MAHPFFEAMEWPGSRPEAQEFEQVLVVAFKTGPVIDQIYNRAAPGLLALNLGQAPGLIWTEALGNLVTSGQLKAFCELLRTQGPANPVFKEKLEAIFTATSAIERRVFTGGVLVVDRASLRSQISLLLAKDSIVTVLLVRGAPKSGKTWGKWLFEAAAKEAGAKPIYVGQGIVFTLEDVIRELFAPVGGIPTQLAEMLANVQSKPTTPDAWFRLICNLLLEAANKANLQLWIAVDDLGLDEQNQPLIDDEILQFFKQFALMMQAAQYQARFRLMLIHFPEGTPTRWSTVIWKADTAVADEIQEEAIVDFLRGWSRERGKVIVEDQLATLSKELIAGLDAPPGPGSRRRGAPHAAAEVPEVPRLQRLFDLLTAMTQKLEQA